MASGYFLFSHDFGYTSNIALCWTPASICTVVVAARIFLRARFRKLDTDDFLMIHAWLGIVVSSCLITASLSVVQDDDHLTTAAQNAQRLYSNLAILLTTLFAKASIAFQIKRVFARRSKWRVWLVMAIIWLLTVITIINIPVEISRPCIAGSQDISEVNCLAISTASNFTSLYNIFNAIVDITLVIIPATFILTFNLPLQKKLPLLVLLALGFTTAIFSILRQVYSTLHPGLPTTARLTNIFTWLDLSLPRSLGSRAAIAPLFRHWSSRKPWKSIGISNDDIREYRRRARSLQTMSQVIIHVRGSLEEPRGRQTRRASSKGVETVVGVETRSDADGLEGGGITV